LLDDEHSKEVIGVKMSAVERFEIAAFFILTLVLKSQ
jgi:hypothetical protein